MVSSVVELNRPAPSKGKFFILDLVSSEIVDDLSQAWRRMEMEVTSLRGGLSGVSRHNPLVFGQRNGLKMDIDEIRSHGLRGHIN